MRDLIEQSIDWASIGAHEKSEYHYEIKDASLSKETGVLTVTLRLNFVAPYLDMEKVRGIVLHQIDDLKDVRFNYIYENVILSDSELIALFIPHMIGIINGRYATITSTIQTKKFQFDGNHLKIYALGRLSTEQLNAKVAVLFSGLLKDNFGKDVKVRFVNDEDRYREATTDWKSSEESDIRASLEDTAKKAEQARKNAPKEQAGGGFSGGNGGFSGGGGFDGGQKGGWKRREKETPAEGNRIMGKSISGNSMPLSDISADSGIVILEGILFKKDSRAIKNEKKLVTLLMTDKKTSVCMKAFALTVNGKKSILC